MLGLFVCKIGKYVQIKPIPMLIQLAFIYPSDTKVEYNYNTTLNVDADTHQS